MELDSHSTLVLLPASPTPTHPPLPVPKHTVGQPHPSRMAPPTPSDFADEVMALGSVAGHRVLGLLGSGTYGCVLEAECVATHTRVALVSECVEANEGERGSSEVCFLIVLFPSPFPSHRKSSKPRSAPTATPATLPGPPWPPSTPPWPV